MNTKITNFKRQFTHNSHHSHTTTTCKLFLAILCQKTETSSPSQTSFWPQSPNIPTLHRPSDRLETPFLFLGNTTFDLNRPLCLEVTAKSRPWPFGWTSLKNVSQSRRGGTR